MRTPLFLRLFGLHVPHHHIGPQTHVGHFNTSMHYFTVRILMFSFFYLHYKKYRMRRTSKWEASLHEDLKNHQQSRKWTSYLQRLDSTRLTWFRESNLLHQCHINFYQTQTYSSLSLVLFMPLATSVSVHITAHKATYTMQVKLIGSCGPQWAKRFAVGP